MKACKGEDKNAKANVWGDLYNIKNTQYIVLKHNIPRVSNYALRNARKDCLKLNSARIFAS